jgi:hypothetical protein
MEIENFLSICTIIVANLGTVLALYLQSDKKIDEARKETNDLIRSIQMEMKDFHGRLCAIEEGRKK